MAKDNNDTRTSDSVVRKGGVAPDDAAAGDVTRDTYGFTGTGNVADTADEHDEARRRAEEVLGLDADETDA